MVDAELWKLGQLRPGDLIEFVPVDETWTLDRQIEISEFLAGNRAELSDSTSNQRGSCFIDSFGEGDESVVVRRAGDRYFLIEFGPHHLDLKLRFTAHVVHEWIKEQSIVGVTDLTPGIRSLQVQNGDYEIPGSHPLAFSLTLRIVLLTLVLQKKPPLDAHSPYP